MRWIPFILVSSLLLGGCGDDDGTGHSGFFGRSLKQLTTSGGRSPAWSPDGASIAYVAGQNLWMISPEGGEPIQLTSMSGSEGDPVWHPNPNRREIVFVNNLGFQKYTIYRLPVDNGELQEVISTTLSISFPSISYDGSLIAYAVDARGRGILLVPLDDGDAMQLENSDGWQLVTAARCSPTDPVIAYVENRADDYNIFIMSLSGKTPTNLTNYLNTAGDINKVWYVDWRKDGQELVFTRSANPYGYTSAIFTIPVSGGKSKAWTEDPIGSYIEYANPSYSPDGNRLVCSHGGELWLLQLR